MKLIKKRNEKNQKEKNRTKKMKQIKTEISLGNARNKIENKAI